MPDVSLRRVDRWPWVVAGIFALATIGALIAVVGLWGTDEASWVQLLIVAFLLVLFAGLAVLHVAIARSHLLITPDVIARTGPRAWAVRRPEVQHLVLRGSRLEITVTQEAARSPKLAQAISETRWFGGGGGPRLIATRVHPDDVTHAKSALRSYGLENN